MTDPRLLVERAIESTRKEAWKQIAIGIGFSALWIAVFKLTTFTIVVLSIHSLITLVLVRRLYRLRARGPAVQALLTAPERIASVIGFPARVPEHQVPVFIDVRTQDGHVCTLQQTPKNTRPTVELVAALAARSPDATFAVANVPPPPASKVSEPTASK